MGDNFIYVVYVAMALLIIVLSVGLWTMLRGGQKVKSQNMMRWRVGVQAMLLVIVIVFVVFFKNSGA
ncbi:MAG: twin transmembrane helix small protein [Rhizobiales bacterium]|nr:twin transmembrane helix small protein [Hyphomicrobiales bacterium]